MTKNPYLFLDLAAKYRGIYSCSQLLPVFLSGAVILPQISLGIQQHNPELLEVSWKLFLDYHSE